MSHTPLGDISLPVGYYLKNGEKKTRRRYLGTLMATDGEQGRRFWIKLNADALSPSLLMLCSKNGILEAGADGLILNVYAPDDGPKKTEEAPPENEPY